MSSAERYAGGAPVASLVWCLEPFRAALTQALAGLARAAMDHVADYAPERVAAQGQVHTVQAVLRVLQLDGVAEVLAATERLVVAGSDSAPLTTECLADLERAWGATLAYLEALAAGNRAAPVVLWPAYRAVQRRLGVERVTPADLMPLDLGCLQWVPCLPMPCDAERLAGARSQLEAAALSACREDAEAPDWGALRDAVLTLAQGAAAEPLKRGVLGVVAALLEAWGAQERVLDEESRPAVMRVHSLLARVIGPSGDGPEGLLRECLFHLAQAWPTPGLVEQVQLCFDLRGRVPAVMDVSLHAALLRRDAPDARPDWASLQAAEVGPPERLREAWRLALAGLPDGAPHGVPAGWLDLSQALRAAVVQAAQAPVEGFEGAPEWAWALLLLDSGLYPLKLGEPEFEAAAIDLVVRLAARGGSQSDALAPVPDLVVAALRPGITHAAQRTAWAELQKLHEQIEDDLAQSLAESRATAFGPRLAERCAVLHSVLQVMAPAAPAQAAQALAQGVVQVFGAAGVPDPAVLDRVAHTLAALGWFIAAAARGVILETRFDAAQGLCLPSMEIPQAVYAGVAQGFVDAAPRGDVATTVGQGPQPEPEPEPDVAAVVVTPAAPVISEPSRVREPVHADVLAAFWQEVGARLPELVHGLSECLTGAVDATQRAALLRQLHALKSAAQMANRAPIASALHALEAALLAAPDTPQVAAAPVLSGPGMGELCASEAPLLQSVNGLGSAAGPHQVPAHRVPAYLASVVDDPEELLAATSRLGPVLDSAREALLQLDQVMTHWYERASHAALAYPATEGARVATPAGDWLPEDPLPITSSADAPGADLTEWVHAAVQAQQHAVRHVDQARRELARHRLRVRALHESATVGAWRTIEPRLQQVVQQAAQTLAKSVRLECVGAWVGLDQRLLHALTPALEHLVRNAVVHGIETPEQRTAQGKPAVGLVSVGFAIERGGARVSCADDGAGLDFAAIAAQAQARAESCPPLDAVAASDEWLAVLIRSGFSTVATPTELAGHGIGLDAVHSVLSELGGHLALNTRPGQGTEFVLWAPLPAAPLSVCGVSAGHTRIAVPAAQIVRVWPCSPEAWGSAQARGVLEVGLAAPVPCIDLAHLLAGAPQASASQAGVWIWLSAQSEHRVLRADRVTESCEVRLQAPGPQLGRLPGLLGLTVLDESEALLVFDLFQMPLARAPGLGV